MADHRLAGSSSRILVLHLSSTVIYVFKVPSIYMIKCKNSRSNPPQALGQPKPLVAFNLPYSVLHLRTSIDVTALYSEMSCQCDQQVYKWQTSPVLMFLLQTRRSILCPLPMRRPGYQPHCGHWCFCHKYSLSAVKGTVVKRDELG